MAPFPTSLSPYTRSISPAVIETAPGRSMCRLAPCWVGSSGSARKASRPATMPMGTLTKNIHLQPSASVRTPPSRTPAVYPADETAVKMPSAWFRRPSGAKILVISARPVAEAMAAPTPWTTLAPMRTTSEVARPAASDDKEKTKRPTRNSLLLL